MSEDNGRDLFPSGSETSDPEGSVLQPSDHAVSADEDDEADDQHFDWSLNDEDIVLQEQSAVAVYANRYGGIVIRREAAMYEAEDAVIVLATAGAAYRVIEAIQRELDRLKAERKGLGAR